MRRRRAPLDRAPGRRPGSGRARGAGAAADDRGGRRTAADGAGGGRAVNRPPASGRVRWLRASVNGLAPHCALLAALACGEAEAHAVLLESSPAANAVLAQAPEQIALRFTEPVRPTAVRLLRAADGASVELGAPGGLRHRAANGAAGEPARGRLRPELPRHLGGRSSGRRQLRVRDRQSRARAQTQALLRPASPTTAGA